MITVSTPQASCAQPVSAPLPGVRTSFLLRSGRLINLAGHRDRLLAAGAAPRSLSHALSSLADLAASSEHDLLFPQLLITADAGTALDPRPIPPSRLRSTAALITHPEPDARRFPHLKGPDFPHQARVRSAAEAADADDAILLGPDGSVRETAFGTLCLVRDETLVVNASAERLASTTEAALRHAWQDEGGQVRSEPLQREDLFTADTVLLLSALHTLRTVTRIDGRPLPAAGAPSSFAAPSAGGVRDTFQKRLWEHADVLTA